MRKLLSLLAAVLAVAAQSSAFAAGTVDSMSYLYTGGTTNFLNNVSRTKESLSIVAPDYFEVTSDGKLKNTKTPDKFFVESMHHAGIQVVPFVSNHWSREAGRAALANANTIASRLAELVEEYGFDGLDIDIENLNQNDRTAFTSFMRTLRNKLPGDKSLSVCVAPNPWGITTGWQGQYDMKALGEICDKVFIMTYDNHYDGDTVSGDVAGLPFIEKSVKQALKDVSASKLMMGVPFYGRYWIEGEETGGKALIISDIYNLTRVYPSTVWYDGSVDSARARMTITEGDVAAGLWGGKKLKAGIYDIWYENETSLEKKLALVKKYNLRGVASWALGQEPEVFWDNYKKWLYELPFTDIYGCWFEPCVTRLYEQGLVSGVSDSKFAPNQGITRAEVCVILCRLLGIAPDESLSGIPEDIKGHWAQGYLTAAIRSGLLAGYEDGLFRPSAKISRQEMAALIAKVIVTGNTIDYNEPVYSDVTRDGWANNAIVALSVHEVISGYPDGTFRPFGTLTRAEAASMIDKIIDFPKNSFTAKLARGLTLTEEPVIEPR